MTDTPASKLSLQLGHPFLGEDSYCEEFLGYDTETGDHYCREPRAAHVAPEASRDVTTPTEAERWATAPRAPGPIPAPPVPHGKACLCPACISRTFRGESAPVPEEERPMVRGHAFIASTVTRPENGRWLGCAKCGRFLSEHRPEVPAPGLRIMGPGIASEQELAEATPKVDTGAAVSAEARRLHIEAARGSDPYEKIATFHDYLLSKGGPCAACVTIQAALDARAQEAAREARKALKDLLDWADEILANHGKVPTYDALYPARKLLREADDHGE